MERQLTANTDLSRRQFLFASGGLLFTRLSWAQPADGPVLYWKLTDGTDTAKEEVSGFQDAISSRDGHARWVGTGRDKALRLDGYSVWVSHSAPHPQITNGDLTIAAWLALESYPVNEAALFDNRREGNAICALRSISGAISSWFDARRAKRRPGTRQSLLPEFNGFISPRQFLNRATPQSFSTDLRLA